MNIQVNRDKNNAPCYYHLHNCFLVYSRFSVRPM